MSRSDLLEVNGQVMRSVAEYIRAGSPEAIVIVVTNPLDSMVTLMRHHLGFPARRVIGMAGVLDSARYSWFISEGTGAAVQDVDAMVLGAHGDSMVPMADRCTVSGIGVLDLLDRDAVEAMGERTKKGGGEIVKLLKTGSAWYAPASASVAMAASILRDEKRLLPCACLLNGEYGIDNLYMGVPAILGASGVERIVELPLRTESRALLQKTAGAIHEDVLAMRDLRALLIPRLGAIGEDLALFEDGEARLANLSRFRALRIRSGVRVVQVREEDLRALRRRERAEALHRLDDERAGDLAHPSAGKLVGAEEGAVEERVVDRGDPVLDGHAPALPLVDIGDVEELAPRAEDDEAHRIAEFAPVGDLDGECSWIGM